MYYCSCDALTLTGGQPADVGVISSADGGVSFKVEHVQKPRGVEYIEHLGCYSSDQR